MSLICVWIYGWVNNVEASDLRRYRAHYDVTVITETAVDIDTIWCQMAKIVTPLFALEGNIYGVCF